MSNRKPDPLSSIPREAPATLANADLAVPARRVSARTIAMTLCSAVVAMALTACGGGSSSSSASNSGPSVSPPGIGSIAISGRINPASTSVSTTTARPDSISAAIDEAAISADGSRYQTIATPASTTSFDEGGNPPPAIGTTDGLTAGSYKALRITVSKMDWSANWGFSNLSPCDSATSGTASGTLDLSTKPAYYFKTADLGGNTAQFYLNNPPLTGYPGDADHPLVLPAPIEIIKDETTTLNLVINTDRTLGCSRVSVFDRTADGNIAPQKKIDGPATGLLGVSMLAVDALRNQVAVASSVNSSINVFSRDATSANPTRVLTGPATLLNNPVGVAFYSAGAASGDGDQYIVANRDNNSITTYTATADQNAGPVRTITGHLVGTSGTGLDQPSGIALYLNVSDPNLDEILVANSGNDSVTAYTRTQYDNTDRLWTISGAAMGLSTPCGIAVDTPNKKVFVTNSGNDSVTVYDIANESTITLASVLQGPATKLSRPCGIAVDTANNEVIVANSGNNGVTVFSNDPANTAYAFAAADTTTPNDIAPIRTITGLQRPVGVQLAGNELWVTDNGAQAEMTVMPTIMPVATNASAANGNLDGNYNIVMYGVDLSKGVNGLGIQIPVLFADRGSVSFDAQAAPWPSFTLKLDTESRRQLMESGCVTPDLQTKNGFYGMGANHHFYAVFQDRQGIIDGSFLSDGQGFTGTFYYGNEIFVIYGTKSTGSTAPYLSTDGTVHGLATQYAYASYYNSILNLVRPIVSLSDTDTLRNELDVGMLYTDATSFIGLNAEANILTILSPMGDTKPPNVTAPRYRDSILASGGIYSTHGGGQFENAAYGMAGNISGDSGITMFMRDVTAKDADSCPLSLGMGLGLTQQPPNTYSVKDFKGTYFLSAFGDKFLTSKSRPKYISTSGTITFDGAGNATIAFVDNTEGELSKDGASYTYKVSARKVNTKALTTTDVIDIYSTTNTTDPYASAIIGQDGRALIFNLNIATAAGKKENTAHATRLLGFAVLENP